MRMELLGAGVFIIASVFAVQMWEHKEQEASSIAPRDHEKAKPASQRSSIYNRTVHLQAAPDRHFYTDGHVNNRAMTFVVDTGASAIALRESDYEKSGSYLRASDFTVGISTANGTTRAARVNLSVVDIGGIRIRDVEAFVLPDDKLRDNLLGMSFLSRLSRFETRGRELILHQ